MRQPSSPIRPPRGVRCVTGFELWKFGTVSFWELSAPQVRVSLAGHNLYFYNPEYVRLPAAPLLRQAFDLHWGDCERGEECSSWSWPMVLSGGFAGKSLGRIWRNTPFFLPCSHWVRSRLFPSWPVTSFVSSRAPATCWTAREVRSPPASIASASASASGESPFPRTARPDTTHTAEHMPPARSGGRPAPPTHTHSPRPAK